MAHYDREREKDFNNEDDEHLERTGLTTMEWKEWKSLARRIDEYEDFMDVKSKRKRYAELQSKLK